MKLKFDAIHYVDAMEGSSPLMLYETEAKEKSGYNLIDRMCALQII